MSTHLSETPFSDLALADILKSKLAEMGMEFCTPIQAESLPITLKGRDCSGQAQTGTGKTLAFLLAALQYLLNDKDAKCVAGKPRALILAPTRELALQIHKDAEVLTKDLNISSAVCYGGKAYEQQKAMFQKPVDILIGTPGRLIDFFKQKIYNLRAAKVLILDEADRMFDMGFIQDVRFLLNRMPDAEQRLSMLFSATMSQKVIELAYDYMNDPLTIKIESASPTLERIQQTLYHPANDEKMPLLIGLLQTLKAERSIIFINTKHAAVRIWEYLTGNHLKAAIISGDINQSRREKLLQKFHNGEYNILVATDVASRGLHIPDVSHIFNYDLPDLGEDYVHRIGRTARAGKKGHAISFACENYAMNLMDIEQYIKRSIPTAKITNDMLVKLAPPVRMEHDKPKQYGKKPSNKNSPRPFNKNSNYKNSNYKGNKPRQHKPTSAR